MPATLGKVWLAIAMLLGLLFVLAMTRVYQINTVPTWYNGYTTSAFFLTVLLSGPLFAALLLRLAKVDFNGWFCRTERGRAGHQRRSYHYAKRRAQYPSQLGSAGGHPAARLRQTRALRTVLLALGLGCWLCPLIRRQPPRATGLLIGLLLVLIAECIGRGLFYGLHMTVGMAVAG